MSEVRYLEIPGNDIYVLPELLITTKKLICAIPANEIVQAEEFLETSDTRVETLFDVQLKIVERYWEIQRSWSLGDDVYRWAIDCLPSLQSHKILGQYFNTAIWPHDYKPRLVELIRQKKIVEEGKLKSALGLRLMFRRQPKLADLSEQCLLQLSPSLFQYAYAQWLEREQNPLIRLPSSRFQVAICSKEIALGSRLERLV